LRRWLERSLRNNSSPKGSEVYSPKLSPSELSFWGKFQVRPGGRYGRQRRTPRCDGGVPARPANAHPLTFPLTSRPPNDPVERVGATAALRSTREHRPSLLPSRPPPHLHDPPVPPENPVRPARLVFPAPTQHTPATRFQPDLRESRSSELAADGVLGRDAREQQGKEQPVMKPTQATHFRPPTADRGIAEWITCHSDELYLGSEGPAQDRANAR